MSDYKIYPSIGVARVGNAPKKFYIGPEVYRGLPTNPDGAPFTENDFRDDKNNLCRQAARFRIYKGTEEITLATKGVKSITWTVHLANKKASWYQFMTNEGELGYAPNHPLRNPNAPDRHKLVIDAGPRGISGANAKPQHFDMASVPVGYMGANFPQGPLNPVNKPIDTLGELQTDAEGRLLVLGGLGVSGTTDKEAQIGDYANNDNWWDDTSDGPVSAIVETDHGRFEVDAGWVVVAPPAYAPEIPNLVTLWDTVFDAAVQAGHYPAIFKDGFWANGEKGYRPNFAKEIKPLLERATLYPWVTAIPSKPHRFDIEKLGTIENGKGAEAYAGLRNWILSYIRAPYDENQIVSSSGGTMMPYLAGDNCLKPNTLTSSYLRLTDTQYFFLSQWAEGWFVNDLAETWDPGPSITRGVLENCVGGPFSPGIEMSWISRNPAIYQADDPFRINADIHAQGPLKLGFDPKHMQPGDICRYMAVPWQADFNECSSQTIGTRTLWWWPSQRPEFVYLEPEPKMLAAATIPAPPEQDSGVQVPWVGTDFDQMSDSFINYANDVEMVEKWASLGFVVEKGPDGGRKFVEVMRDPPRYQPPTKAKKA
jgi:hypothetical protein